jgi:outer membrane lipoprotein LolB
VVPDSALRHGVWLLMLLLTACAVQPPQVSQAPRSTWLKHRATLEGMDQWQAQGRIAVRVGDEGWNANFDWRQLGADYRIRLRGPFGQGAVELAGDPRQGVWLRRADAPPRFALDPETLLLEETGWQLPVAGLSDWLRGLPVADAEPSLVWDERGRLVALEQDGWQIDYRRYQTAGGVELPALLVLQQERVRVKFVIDTWQLQ